jgi:hypothetical protein
MADWRSVAACEEDGRVILRLLAEVERLTPVADAAVLLARHEAEWWRISQTAGSFYHVLASAVDTYEAQTGEQP